MKIHGKFVFSVLISIFIAGCVQQPALINETITPINQSPPPDTPTPSLIPDPTPTEISDISIDQGEIALLVGDYDAAFDYFSEMLSNTKDPNLIAKSNLGIGQTLLAQDILGSALDYLRIAASAEDPVIAARANFQLGRTYTKLERYDEAISAYDTYLDLRPDLLDDHVLDLLGDLYLLQQNYPQAITHFEEAYQLDPSGGSEALAVKIAETYEALGNLETAMILYQEIYNSTDNDYTKARMNLLMGRIYLSQGNTQQAYVVFQDSVDNYSYTFDAYSALVILVNDEIPVNEYKRGLVNYFVGNNTLAIDAFNRYLSQESTEFTDAALYYKALATRAYGLSNGGSDYEAAVTIWQNLIDTYPSSQFFIDAWEDIEFTLWAYLDEPQRAAEVSLSYVTLYPESGVAPNFLFLAGRSFERAGLLEEASETWVRIANEYPNSEETFRAIYFAAIAQVRNGSWENAQALFSRALVLTSQPEEIAAANLWIGKCQEALGDISTAVDTWKLAQTADPFGYYSIRAEDLLIGRDIFSEPDTFDLDDDLTPYILEAETWLKATFNLPEEINLESPGLLANDPTFQRGLEFWALGDYEAGKAQFEALRTTYQDDPAQTFRLIQAFVDIGLYRSALVASTTLLRSAGLERADALNAPEFFSRVRFGAYYIDWVLPIASEQEISPLLLLAIIRQESTYEGFISSSAGAQGLMQIIPSTGQQLADELQWPEDYTPDDLNRPYVSLVFGSNYLRKQRNFFNGDLYAMLAAYNGGPGNTIAWKELTGSDDPDLFLETVRIEETRNYIRLIYEIYYIYRWLYGSPMDL